MIRVKQWVEETKEAVQTALKRRVEVIALWGSSRGVRDEEVVLELHLAPHAILHDLTAIQWSRTHKQKKRQKLRQ